MWWRGKARIIFCGGKEENDDALNGESEGIGVLREQSGSVRGSEHRLARSGPVRHRPFSSSQQQIKTYRKNIKKQNKECISKIPNHLNLVNRAISTFP